MRTFNLCLLIISLIACRTKKDIQSSSSEVSVSKSSDLVQESAIDSARLNRSDVITWIEQDSGYTKVTQEVITEIHMPAGPVPGAPSKPTGQDLLPDIFPNAGHIPPGATVRNIKRTITETGRKATTTTTQQNNSDSAAVKARSKTQAKANVDSTGNAKQKSRKVDRKVSSWSIAAWAVGILLVAGAIVRYRKKLADLWRRVFTPIP